MPVRRLREERGFTLVELLAVMLIGGVVLAGVASLIQVVMRQSTNIVSRTDASQRGRLVMDQMTRQLRSQVCLDLGYVSAKPALVEARHDVVTFYTDLSDGSEYPVKQGLQYDGPGNRILEHEYDRTSADGARPTTYAASPSKTRVLLTNVTADDDVTAADGKFFRFRKYNADRTVTEDVIGDSWLAPADLAAIAEITISMDVRPAASKKAEHSTVLTDSVLVRNLNENTDYSPTNPKALLCQ